MTADLRLGGSRRHSRWQYALNLICAALLGFIVSPLLIGHDDCRPVMPRREAAVVSAPLIALRTAAHEVAEAEPQASETPAIARWIDDHAILLLEIAVSVVALLGLLLIIVTIFTPYRPIEPEHSAHGDTGPWPQFHLGEDR
jgi:hypothetical protein